MGLGFASKSNEIIEEGYIPKYRAVIECTVCGDKELTKVYKGHCSCRNLYIDILELECEYMFKMRLTHFKTITYDKELPLIYDVLIADELP